MEQLREQTRPAHLALETQPLLKQLLSSRLTRAEYGQVLQAMLAFYQSLELELVPAAAALLRRHPSPDYQYLPRAPLLADDCRALGCASAGFIHPPVEIQLGGRGANLPGVLYVIEGSTQGGKFIAKHLAHTLGVSEDSGASFFHNQRWANSWPAFRRWFGTDWAHDRQAEIDSVIAGANMTFSALHTHFDHWQGLTHGR
ncbi:biliverdin-producing heme oxygenase [Haliea sp. E1-2-M8]|uniref:biliverdin-producing heme oxygenase n=1 Tax=Haliea sp. E1-2-M8 TaxID=3064706 RepID=UPI00271A5673|nr:biliverdin-producing heme oxygenase [Haliea sp. E1-2-M8]MDO8860402.1 biliverdin-producing heme oxygenase [Haliea sp. E1-2-M8]